MAEITTWITSHGVNEQTLLILLYIPVLATLVNFSRYFVGLKTLGIYAPMTLAFAYIFTGIRFGLLVTVAVIVATLVSYAFLKKIRMHYMARIAINYILITAFIILIITLNDISPIQFTTSNHNAEMIPPLGILLIATLSDFFIKQNVKKSLFATMRSLLETILIGMIGWALLKWENLGIFLYENLWFMGVLILVNLAFGKYQGLRIKEFFRFNKLSEITAKE